jgi:hypothetical protein
VCYALKYCGDDADQKDIVRSKNTLDKYMNMDPAFKGTRECNLCTVLKYMRSNG